MRIGEHMPGDLNIVILTGQIITDPLKSKLNYQKTPITIFTLQTNEYFRDGVTGKQTYHSNILPIQTLGRNADIVADRFRKGMRVYVDGYLRTDDEKSFSVRTHAVHDETTFYAQKYYEGLEHALDIVRTSRDKEAAVDSLMKVLAREGL